MSPGRRVRVEDVVRRRRTPRFDAVTVLALVIPLVTLGALALVRQPPVHETTHRPALTQLTSTTVVCPAADSVSPSGGVATASGASGDLTITSGDGSSTAVPVSPGTVTPLSGSDPAVVQGDDELAPGLLGIRYGTSPLTTQACSVPSSSQWFAGVGAGPQHDSVIELVNPDAGPADVDITLYGTRSFTKRKLHGITIPAHRTVRLDLGKIAPKRVLLSAQVAVTRGRLAVHVLDSRTDLVTHKVVHEWVPAQAAPALELRLLGLPTGPGKRTLQLANPGDDVARAEVKIITGDTTFAPAALTTVTVQPGSTTTVPMTKVLARALDDGAVGVQVTADGPLVASVLTLGPTDAALTVPNTDIRSGTATLLPVVPAKAPAKAGGPVTATAYVSADAAGVVTVKAYDATGQPLPDQRVGMQQGHTATIELPKGAAYVLVVPERTVIRASVVVQGDGASVVPMQELLTQGLVPHIEHGQN
jgi:hypothetical protein